MGHAWLHALAALVALLTAGGPAPDAAPERPRVEWRDSTAIGLPEAGRLERGVKLPSGGRG
jgi:hypothetical protein